MAGGAPANAAAMCAAQAGAQKPILIASVGDDEFGSWLTRSLFEGGVDLAGVRKIASHLTSVAFALNRRSTNQRFRFYRDADLHISPEQVSCLEAGSLGSLTYGSLSLVPDAHFSTFIAIGKIDHEICHTANVAGFKLPPNIYLAMGYHL